MSSPCCSLSTVKAAQGGGSPCINISYYALTSPPNCISLSSLCTTCPYWSTIIDTNAGTSIFEHSQFHNGPLDWYTRTQVFTPGETYVHLSSSKSYALDSSWNVCLDTCNGTLNWETEFYEDTGSPRSVINYLEFQWDISESASRDCMFTDPANSNKAFYVPFLRGVSDFPVILHVDVSGSSPIIENQVSTTYSSSNANGTSGIMPNGDIITTDGSYLYIWDASSSPAYSTGTRIEFDFTSGGGFYGIWHVASKGDDIVVVGYGEDASGASDKAIICIIDSDYSTINASTIFNTQNSRTYMYCNWVIVSGDDIYVLHTEDDFDPNGASPVIGGTNYPGVTKLDADLNIVWSYSSAYVVDGLSDAFNYNERGAWMPSMALDSSGSYLYVMIPDTYRYYTWSYAESNGGGYLLKIATSDASIAWEKKLDATQYSPASSPPASIHSPRVATNSDSIFFCGYYNDGDGVLDKVCVSKMSFDMLDASPASYHIWNFIDQQQWSSDWTRRDGGSPWFEESSSPPMTITVTSSVGTNEDKTLEEPEFTESTTTVEIP